MAPRNNKEAKGDHIYKARPPSERPDESGAHAEELESAEDADDYGEADLSGFGIVHFEHESHGRPPYVLELI
jgi:hypothetical protein